MSSSQVTVSRVFAPDVSKQVEALLALLLAPKNQDAKLLKNPPINGKDADGEQATGTNKEVQSEVKGKMT